MSTKFKKSLEQTPYCRLCRVTAKNLLKKATKEAKENFYSITSLKVRFCEILTHINLKISRRC